MKRIVWLFLVTSFSVVHGFEWPVKDISVTGTFGEPRNDHFHKGIDLAGADKDVYPIAPGEVVFTYDEGTSYSSIPVGLGSYVLLEDREGIRSLYCHLKKGSIDSGKKKYRRNQAIGTIGDTGYSLGPHLHLSILDHNEGFIMNPLHVLSYDDRKVPVIENLYYEENGHMVALKSRMSFPPSKVRLFVKGYDLRDDVRYKWTLSPYELILLKNGIELTRIVFDTIRESDGRVYVEDHGKSLPRKDFGDVYHTEDSLKDMVNLGIVEFMEGVNHVQVIIRDYSGKEAVKQSIVTVRAF